LAGFSMWPDRGMSLSLGEAEQYFNEAAAKNARIGAWPYLVRTRRACAGMLLDRDAPEDCARAVKLIEEGSADADHLGMRRELDRFDPPAPPNERVFGSENGS
jgi:hypothetical protein